MTPLKCVLKVFVTIAIVSSVLVSVSPAFAGRTSFDVTCTVPTRIQISSPTAAIPSNGPSSSTAEEPFQPVERTLLGFSGEESSVQVKQNLANGYQLSLDWMKDNGDIVKMTTVAAL